MVSWNSSYVFGYDNESGWGGRYFFTYFNEFEERTYVAKFTEVGVFGIIFVISVITNVAIATCVVRFPDMKTVTNCFVLNLAAADLLFAFSIPAVAYSRLTTSWLLGNFACKLIPYIEFVSGIVLLWTLTLISMDRHRCIVVPPYRSKISTSQARVNCAITWILTAVLFVPVLLWFREQQTEDNKYVCTIIFPRSESINFAILFTVPVLFMTCILPMIILVYNYQKIFKKIISTKNTWASSCVTVSSSSNTNNGKGSKQHTNRRQSEVSLSEIFTPWPRKCSSSHLTSSNGRHGSLSHQEEIRLNKHVKVVRILFLNVLVVLIMWLPITIIVFLIFLDGRRPTEDKNYFLRSYHFIVSLMIAFCNTVVNPLLYGVLSDNFRACLLKMCCSRFRSVGNDSSIKENTFTPSSCRNRNSYKANRKQSYINSVSDKHNDTL